MFEKSRIVASIPAQWPFHPSYMHSFGKTQKLMKSFKEMSLNFFQV